MKILIKNCILVSMDDTKEKIQNNIDILINENKIEKISKNIAEKIDYTIDATGKVVMPGLINTHSHVPMSIFRETLDGYTLQDWLSKKIWPVEDNLTKEDIYNASCLSYIEMIKTGTTTINDMYFLTEDIIKAQKECGIRLQTTRTLMDRLGIEEGRRRFKELKNLMNNYIDEKLTFNAGVHSLYTADSEYVSECIEFAKENNLIIHMHFCENNTEVEDIKRIHNAEPISILKEKFKDTKLILAHCVKLSKKDINEIKDMDISVSHCPISNLKLGCGIADIDYMMKSGINVSLGTDGQGSACNLDMFETMKYAALLQKGINEDPKLMDAYNVLKMATINGAKALGLDNEIGTIKEGKIADIIIIDLDDIKIKPINNLISELVYNVKGNNVDTTIVNGKILMENKKLINIKEEEIIEKCNLIASKIEV